MGELLELAAEVGCCGQDLLRMEEVSVLPSYRCACTQKIRDYCPTRGGKG